MVSVRQSGLSILHLIEIGLSCPCWSVGHDRQVFVELQSPSMRPDCGSCVDTHTRTHTRTHTHTHTRTAYRNRTRTVSSAVGWTDGTVSGTDRSSVAAAAAAAAAAAECSFTGRGGPTGATDVRITRQLLYGQRADSSPETACMCVRVRARSH
jgi:hypothetical protein